MLWFAAKAADGTARISAQAARDAVALAEKTLTDLEGPFLFPVIISDDIERSFSRFKVYANSDISPVRPSVEIAMKNHGRTAALPTHFFATFFMGDPTERQDDGTDGSFGEAIIGPGETSQKQIERVITRPITAEDFRTIEKRGARIFIKGQIIFADIFGHRFEQTFCLEWARERKGFTAWQPQQNRRTRVHGSGDAP